jgi:hypothetical protein
MNKRVIKTESKRVIKTDGLSLEDVVELKNISIEWERQDLMFMAEREDLMPDRVIKLTGPESTYRGGEGSSLERARRASTYFWPEVFSVPGATVEEKAVHLAPHKSQLPSNVWRKLLLDLVVDITPLDKPVPNTLIALLRDELGLPKNHDVGGWPLTARMRRDSGGSDHEARECASLIDCNHIDALLTHKDETTRLNAVPMPLNMLQREVKAKLGRAPATKTLREWRENLDYWDLTQEHRQAQLGGRGK